MGNSLDLKFPSPPKDKIPQTASKKTPITRLISIRACFLHTGQVRGARKYGDIQRRKQPELHITIGNQNLQNNDLFLLSRKVLSARRILFNSVNPKNMIQSLRFWRSFSSYNKRVKEIKVEFCLHKVEKSFKHLEKLVNLKKLNVSLSADEYSNFRSRVFRDFPLRIISKILKSATKLEQLFLNVQTSMLCLTQS